MIGDQADMLVRVKSVLPSRWFPDATPVLDGLLSGLAATASWAYALLATVRLQTRLGSANGAFLDMAANDFFGGRVRRASTQTDAAFRTIILRELFRPRTTRPALIQGLIDVSGRSPDVFEPARPLDTGSWNGRLAYNAVGRWGSLGLPNQVFVTAYRASAATPTMPIASDAEILSTVAGLLPVASIAWTRIAS